MILGLPNTLLVDGEEKEIYTDFRNIINIFVAMNDKELNDFDKTVVMLELLYKEDYTNFKNLQEAIDKAVWFLDWGKEHKSQKDAPQLLDWEQDYNLIISAVNKVANKEVRELPHLHWWTFLGYFSERGECQYSHIMEIRDKLAKNKKLEPYEKEILRENRETIIIKDKSAEQFEDDIFGGE